MIAVVGGGAAGLMAAIHAARRGGAVTLFERMPDGGRKILISGGGRCNVLPSELEPRRFVTASSPNTLRRLLTSWPLDQQRAFFERDLGIPLALEQETGKLFPVSNRARHIRDGLFSAANSAGVTVRRSAGVVDLVPCAEGWRLSLADGGWVDADRVVLATGGSSVPQTGSDGTGFAIAARLGIPIKPIYPALTPLLEQPATHADLSGISLPVEITATAGAHKRTVVGGFLFTHRGYSGPAILDVSDLVSRAVLGLGPAPSLLVRWTPEYDRGAWEQALQEQSGRRVATALRAVLPDRLADRLLDRAGVAQTTEFAQLTRDGRTRLVDMLTRYPLPWSGDEGYRKAEVTGGGVALDAVDPATLECRTHPGLFLCGEILDAFGPIGGHNFSWAWATGRLAGLAAA